jgi:hypothetical protein
LRKLRQYDLQLIDSQNWNQKRKRRTLEVEDLEDEVAGLSTRSEKIEKWAWCYRGSINNQKNGIEDKEAIKKYTNNRKLFVIIEIQLFNKRSWVSRVWNSISWKNEKAVIEHKKDTITQSKERLETKSNHLKHVRIDAIMAETAKGRRVSNRESAEYQNLIWIYWPFIPESELVFVMA